MVILSVFFYHSFKIKGVTRVSRETTAGPQLRQTHIKVRKDIFSFFYE